MKSTAIEDLLYCERCKCTLQYTAELDNEDDEMFICMKNDGMGGELIYCGNCFTTSK